MAKVRFEKRCSLLKDQKGRCHWCGKEMILRYQNGGPVWPNEITIDHLDERLGSERGAHPGEIRRVGACGECNKRRNDEATSAIPRERLHDLSNRHPSKEPPQ